MSLRLTELKLLNVPFDDLSNVIKFADTGSQLAFMNSKVKHTFTDFSYQRENSYIRVPLIAESCHDSNYVMFRNEQRKYFFGFITRIDYVSPVCSHIYFMIDPWQTYLFDMTIGVSFVEREHIPKNLDVPGYNTITENLPKGRLKYELPDEAINHSYAEKYYIIGCKKDLQGNDMSPVNVYGSIFACGLYGADSVSGMQHLVTQLEQILTNNVLFVQCIPSIAQPSTASDGRVISTVTDTGIEYQQACVRDITIARPTNLGGYTPQNAKLLCYPYCYLTVTSNQGAPMEYPFENFYGANCTFTVAGECSRNPLLTCVPKNFEGQAYNFDKKVISDCYPSIPYQNDNAEYYNYAKAFMSKEISIDRGNMAFDMIKAGIGVGGNAVSKNWGGAASGTIDIGKTPYLFDQSVDLREWNLGVEEYRNSKTYNNGSATNILMQWHKLGFRFYITTITSEYAHICDDYLTKYGYATFRLKQPEINSRSRFNYVKTNGANIYGDIPKPQLDALKMAFDSGITIWHDSNLYDYSNNI